jgi:hypothetical protein
MRVAGLKVLVHARVYVCDVDYVVDYTALADLRYIRTKKAEGTVKFIKVKYLNCLHLCTYC